MNFLRRNNHKLLVLIFILIIFVTILSVSYSYYKVNYQEEVDEVVSTDIECLNVGFSGSKINVAGDNAVPVYDSVALSSDTYKATIVVTNQCDTRKAYTLAYADSIGERYADRINHYKYAVHEIGTEMPTEGSFFPQPSTTAADQIYALHEYQDAVLTSFDQNGTIYPLHTMFLKPNETKTFDVYTWIDYNEGDQTGSGLNDNESAGTYFWLYFAIIKGNIIDTSGSFANTLVESAITPSEIVTGESALVDFGEFGVRYIGDNPNNFVRFNDELWRIVGVFEDDSHGVTGQKLVKIVKATPYTKQVPWDASSGNDNVSTQAYWTRSQLMLLLNPSEYNTYYRIENNNAYYGSKLIQGNVGSYYNNTSHCYPANKTSCVSLTDFGALKDDSVRNMIQEVQIPMYLSTENADARGTYYSERTSASPGNGIQYDDPWRGKVLLLNQSDAIFASSGYDDSHNYEYCLNIKSSFCSQNNWILNTSNYTSITLSGTWTINSIISNNKPYIRTLSSISTKANSYPNVFTTSGLVRPVVYLKPNVVIKGGSGTIHYPYILMQFDENE